MDEPGEVPSHEEDGEEMYEEPSEALLATPELNISGAFPRRGSTSVQGSTLSPVAARTRRLPSVTRRKQPIPKALSLRRQLGISRFAVALLLLLLFFGLNEVLRGGDVHRRKGRPSEPVLTTRWVHSPRTLLRTLHLPKPPSPRPLTPEQRDELNTTAIVLTYQRRSNVLVVASHLCQYTDSIFRDVLIWNNDPLRSLTIAVRFASGFEDSVLILRTGFCLNGLSDGSLANLQQSGQHPLPRPLPRLRNDLDALLLFPG